MPFVRLTFATCCT